MPDISRRDFIKLATNGLLGLSGALGLIGIIRFLSYTSAPPPPATFDIGLQSKYPLGSHTVLADIPAILIHTESGFDALSLVCTHLGCTVESRNDSFICPCHGSQYDANGNVTRGPASKPLVKLKVELSREGNLIVRKS